MNHKDLLRERIRKQTDEYLARGGRIHEVASGISGEKPDQRRPASSVFSGQRQSRTEVPEVIAAIEARKQALRPRRRPARKGLRARGPRRRMIYDDFGEPLRWEWVDD